MARVRTSKNIPLKPLVVIFSDGRTELNYFSCKKSDLKGKRNVRIEPVFANEKKATEMVKYAKDYIRNNYGNEPNDRYFCVMDMDRAADADIKTALKQKPKKWI